MKVEAEGGELVLRNRNGTVAIIKASDRNRVLAALEVGNSSIINDLVASYPSASDYAQEGTKVPKKDPSVNPQLFYETSRDQTYMPQKDFAAEELVRAKKDQRLLTNRQLYDQIIDKGEGLPFLRSDWVPTPEVVEKDKTRWTDIDRRNWWLSRGLGYISGAKIVSLPKEGKKMAGPNAMTTEEFLKRIE